LNISLGSVVKRAGELQRRKFRAMSLDNVEKFLSAQVNEKLEKFRIICETSLSEEFLSKERRLLPITNRFIKFAGRGRKAVAVFDPETSMVVKMYTSVKNAFSVFQFLEKIGHTPGCKELDERRFISLINSCTAHCGKRFYGYQWLLMDSLRFPKKKSKQTADFESHSLANNSLVLKAVPYMPVEVGVNNTAPDTVSWKYVKIDKVGDGPTLAKYESFESAASDWLECYKVRLREGEPLDDDWRGIFKSKYLDGDLTIDGMAWCSVHGDDSSMVACADLLGKRSETSSSES